MKCKSRLWLFVLVCLTALDGGPLWIDSAQFVAVGRTPPGASPESKSEIWTSGGATFFVKETADEVAEKLK